MVHTVFQNAAYRNQLPVMAFHQNLTHLKKAGPLKRFKCEAIPQANWEQQISSNLSYLKPETKTLVVCKNI